MEVVVLRTLCRGYRPNPKRLDTCTEVRLKSQQFIKNAQRLVIRQGAKVCNTVTVSRSSKLAPQRRTRRMLTARGLLAAIQRTVCLKPSLCQTKHDRFFPELGLKKGANTMALTLSVNNWYRVYSYTSGVAKVSFRPEVPDE